MIGRVYLKNFKGRNAVVEANAEKYKNPQVSADVLTQIGLVDFREAHIPITEQLQKPIEPNRAQV